MHRAHLRRGHQEDHDVHRNHGRQDHAHQGDLTEAYPQQAVCQAQPEQPTALVLQQEALPQEASQLLAAWQASELASA